MADPVMRDPDPSPPTSLTHEDIREILRRNGISDLNDLINSIAASNAEMPGEPDISPYAGSYVVKVWALDAAAPGEMPDSLGGDIIRRSRGDIGDAAPPAQVVDLGPQ